MFSHDLIVRIHIVFQSLSELIAGVNKLEQEQQEAAKRAAASAATAASAASAAVDTMMKEGGHRRLPSDLVVDDAYNNDTNSLSSLHELAGLF